MRSAGSERRSPTVKEVQYPRFDFTCAKDVQKRRSRSRLSPSGATLISSTAKIFSTRSISDVPSQPPVWPSSVLAALGTRQFRLCQQDASLS